jgi:ABC-type metal ion transport system substrate-binding protein
MRHALKPVPGTLKHLKAKREMRDLDRRIQAAVLRGDFAEADKLKEEKHWVFRNSIAGAG